MHVIHVKADALFQALADATRVRIVRLLAADEGEACLCELVDSLRELESKLSRHLKHLRQAGVLDAEKDGKFVYHRLVTRHEHLRQVVTAIRALPDSDGSFAADRLRFDARMRLRDGGRCRVGIQTMSVAGALDGSRTASRSKRPA
ncbi:MAG: transcriptional regulator [Leptothrix sp. (in: Bacteria)]|nr:transcriptional regulator [Leptothrix sp. (in: b-proteobacteria)]